MKTASQLLSRKGTDFNVITPDTPVMKAIHHMGCVNSDFVVVKAGDLYLGIVTEADYTRKVVMRNQHERTLYARDIMNSNLPIVSMQDSVEKCMQLMQQFHVHYLPVFEEMNFVGIITMDDIIREALLDHDIFDRKAEQVA